MNLRERKVASGSQGRKILQWEGAWEKMVKSS